MVNTLKTNASSYEKQNSNTIVTNISKKSLNENGYNNFEEWNKNERHVYIGRNTKCFKKSIWANPFTVKKYGIEGCLEKYKEHIKSNPELMKQLFTLDGKVLGCIFEGNRCHGDILIELIEEQKKEYSEKLLQGISEKFNVDYNSLVNLYEKHFNTVLIEKEESETGEIGDLTALNTSELKQLAKNTHKVKGISSLKKEELITIIKSPVSSPKETDYTTCNVQTLKDIAKEKGLRGYSKLNKQALLHLLNNTEEEVEVEKEVEKENLCEYIFTKGKCKGYKCLQKSCKIH